ncbi:alpha/beta hydrolase [Ferruginibacter yonginensis]|uniref:Alpha/beta hydrolase n=1 Tax=Ferruginibacter yonginensis TaxID=1310416 RepID=A0ABV8QUY2_9BACT
MPIQPYKIYRIIKITLLIYALIGIALYYLQEKFIFHPTPMAAKDSFHFTQKFEEVRLPINDDDTLSVVKFFTDDTLKKGVVLYYHGNRGNITRYASFVKPFTDNGYDVWMEDYPSFGKSVGVLTEQKLYSQALQVKKMADAQFKTEQIIIYGKSLGTSIAAYVASESPAQQLILETPYYSMQSLFKRYAFIYPTSLMCKYKLPTYTFLSAVKYPVTIFHGTNDGVIPYSNALKLKNVFKTNDTFITIDGADHQNINIQPSYYSALKKLL